MSSKIEDLIEDLRGSVEEEMKDLLKSILTAKTQDDKLDMLGNAVVDGRTELWENSLRFATILESVLEDDK